MANAGSFAEYIRNQANRPWPGVAFCPVEVGHLGREGNIGIYPALTRGAAGAPNACI